MIAHSRFPPSFHESALAYGFALFGLTLISAISLALLVGNILEARHNRQIDLRLGNWVVRKPIPTVTALSLYRVKICCLLSVIICGALPDVLLLLAWGEGGDAMILNLYTLDRFADGFAIVPFLLFVSTFLMSGGAVSHRLALDPREVDLVPRWARIRDKVKMTVLAFLIAVGVTLYKASL